jgi:hypothetical protein
METKPHTSRRSHASGSARTDQGAVVRRWLHGQALAAVRIRQAAAEEGPDPRQAVAEALSAVNALAEMGLWPGPRDPASEAAVIKVRERWARIQKRAMRARAR